MEEKQLEILFKNFLLSKGFSNSNFLSQMALRTSDNGVFRPDLVILDIKNKEYIAIIEFKNKISEHIKINTLGQIYKYFSLLGTDSIPAFLVFPISENDFQILILTTENNFEPITKEEFPLLETLSAQRITETKIKNREVEENTLSELKEKKKRSKQSAYFSLVSLILGITASIVAVFVQQKSFTTESKTPINFCCDSINHKYDIVNEKLLLIESFHKDSLLKRNRIDTILISSNLNKVEQRLSLIEKGISNNPEKTLSILDLRKEIALLQKSDENSKELTQSKIDSLKSQMEVQNAWMLGVLIAIFGTILSLVIPNLMSNRNRNNSE
jgi:hypothetical protein